MTGPRVLNKKRHGVPFDAVYVGRTSRWGNSYRVGVHGNRDQVIALHRKDIMDLPDWGEIQRELRGKDLVCNCAPKPCHADVLLEVANMDPLI